MKNEIALVIPTSILIKNIKELNNNDKLVFGLHYAYFKKGGKTVLSQKEFGKKLDLHPNIVSRCNLKLVKYNYLKKIRGDYEVVEDTINQLPHPNGTKEIILPFEVYNRKNINGGEKLLWGEYNKFRDSEFGCYQTKETIATNIGSSKISIGSWKDKLFEQKMIYYGEYQNRQSVFTVDFRDLPIDEVVVVKEPKNVVDEEKTPNKPKENKVVEEEFYDRAPLSVYRPTKKKTKNKKTKEEKELRKRELEEEKQQYLIKRKELGDIDFYNDLID